MRAVKGTPKHLSKAGQLHGFTYLMLNLEFTCNYKCPKCFNMGAAKQKYPPEQMLTLQDRLDLIGQAQELGGKVVVIAGEGEPTIHKDIRTLVTEINSSSMIPVVYSNGRALHREVIEFYAKNNSVLVLSLDSLQNKRYDYLTGTKNQLQQVLANIQILREIYRGRIETLDDLTVLSTAINTTVSSVNNDEVHAIKEFCAEDIYFICNPLARLGNAVDNWEGLVNPMSKIEDYAPLIRSMSESGGPLTLDSAGLCGYSSNGVAIGPYGHYMTCAYTQLTNDLLGNIKETPLKKAFEYKNAREQEHYKKHGTAPCLVRMPSFQEYLQNLAHVPIVKD